MKGKYKVKVVFKKSSALVLVIWAALMAALLLPTWVHADSIGPGVYSVEVIPVYLNPDTGIAEDTGQNPGIGQMMVEAQVQTAGCIEVMDDGTMYLNTRWNLAEPTIYAGFSTSSDGSSTWKKRNFDVTRQVNAGEYEFQGQNFDAVVTDFRFKIDGTNDTIRCTNWVDAMGRQCIWYCYLSNIREGIDDTWNVVQKPSMANYAEKENREKQPDKVEEPRDENESKDKSEKPKAKEKSKDKVKEKKKDEGIVGMKEQVPEENKVVTVIGSIIVFLFVLGIIMFMVKHRKKRKR